MLCLINTPNLDQSRHVSQLSSGIQETVLTDSVKEQLSIAEANDIEFKIDSKAECKHQLSKLIQGLVLSEFSASEKNYKDGKDHDQDCIDLCNKLIQTINEHGESTHSEVTEKGLLLEFGKTGSSRPNTSLSKNALFTGSTRDLQLGSQYVRELKTADSVDILCAFITWGGIVSIKNELSDYTESGRKLRVITTAYMGATDSKAVEFLADLPNCEVKISYDTKRTRLHAKASMFHRESGFSAAYVGSSNISKPALSTGLEWNIKVSEAASESIWEKACITFEEYWHSSEFSEFKTEEDRERLRKALKSEKRRGENALMMIDVKPHPYQEPILDQIKADRERYGKSLVVAATGTGKTMLSAFDYKAFADERITKGDNHTPTLLFVAHRGEILKQSWDSFRLVMRDQNFGEMQWGNHEANLDSAKHLFISVQSLNSCDLCNRLNPEHFDYIIVDEFHHAKADSYDELLKYFQPKFLLGLTATPERMDGLDITEYFDGREHTVDIRLPEAISNDLLCRFHYFGITDEVDYESVKWSRGKYDVKELTNIYTTNDLRVDLIIRKLDEYLLAPLNTRGLGFCVSKEHANYMAKKFSNKGIPSVSLTSDSSDEERAEAIPKLKDREINFIFTVDLFNEGVDIPFLDTVLFLRPTDSLTIFLQQLGRGLRKHDEKDYLNVFDFIGQHRKEYNLGQRLKALVGRSKKNIKTELEEDFPTLPAGCVIQIEKIARKHVLENITRSIEANNQSLVNSIQRFESETGEKPTLTRFLRYHDLDVEDFYGGQKRSWEELLNLAGIKDNLRAPDLVSLKTALRKIVQIDSEEYLTVLREILPNNAETKFSLPKDKRSLTILSMFHFTLWGDKNDQKTLNESIERLQKNSCLLNEIREVLDIKYKRAKPSLSKIRFNYPLNLHCTYTRREILTALGHSSVENAPPQREGVSYIRDKNIDVFFVTFNKDELFHEDVRYEDYAINENLFHWQSQNSTSLSSETGQRYINQRNNGTEVLLFAREYSKVRNISQPFTFFGPMDYVSHQGEKPISLTWRLQHPMSPDLLPCYLRAAV